MCIRAIPKYPIILYLLFGCLWVYLLGNKYNEMKEKIVCYIRDLFVNVFVG